MEEQNVQGHEDNSFRTILRNTVSEIMQLSEMKNETDEANNLLFFARYCNKINALETLLITKLSADPTYQSKKKEICDKFDSIVNNKELNICKPGNLRYLARKLMLQESPRLWHPCQSELEKYSKKALVQLQTEKSEALFEAVMDFLHRRMWGYMSDEV